MSKSLIQRKVLAIILMMISVWPAYHYYLVHNFDLNPWKMFGFAMYCTTRAYQFEKYDTTGGRIRPINEELLTKSTVNSIERYALLRKDLGQLYEPDGIVKQMFDELPRTRAMAIIISTLWLDGSTGKIKKKYRVYRYAKTTRGIEKRVEEKIQ